MISKMGRINREKMLHKSLWISVEPKICPLCSREIPKHLMEAHHLIPKSKGGVKTEFLHSICHRQIHALFSENELANHFNTVESLLSHPDFLKFISWVQTKPIDFKQGTRKSKRLKLFSHSSS